MWFAKLMVDEEVKRFRRLPLLRLLSALLAWCFFR